MSTEFALDLRLARRKAGLTQRDISHLLVSHQTTVSDLERGRVLPSVVQICTLSAIYGRSFESLFSTVMTDARRELLRRLKSLPDDVRDCAGTFNREGTLARLKERLKAEAQNHGSA